LTQLGSMRFLSFKKRSNEFSSRLDFLTSE
jgi:hypothetical protein